MAQSSSPPDPLSALVEALQTTLKVEKVETLDAFRSVVARDSALPASAPHDEKVRDLAVREAHARRARLMVGKRLRIGGFYDIEPDIALFDPGLGTLAFVQHIARDGGSKPAVLKAIESATAVRQILMEEASRTWQMRVRERGPGKPAPVRPLSLHVELVLVVSGAPDATVEDPLRTTLTEVARDTGYLRLIGVGVLDLHQHPTMPEAVLRRVFPWLLRSARAWFDESRFGTGETAWRPAGADCELRLEEYRTTGHRAFRCSGDAWLNLVHGHNGSGKSALAEAIELLLTGRIQRLDEAPEVASAIYFPFIRHRPVGVTDVTSLSAASAQVYVRDIMQSGVRIAPGSAPVREGKSPANGVQVNSFRIDQVFMDRLIRSSPTGRAELFLDAFAPQEKTLLHELEQLRFTVRSAWPLLPEYVRKKAELEAGGNRPVRSETQSVLSEDEMAAFIARELSSVDALAADADSAMTASPVPVTAAAIESVLPLPKEDIARIGQIYPQVQQRLTTALAATDRSTALDALSQLLTALVSVSSVVANAVTDLRASLRIFQEFRSWKAERTISGRDFKSDLDEWLELQALVDVVTRSRDIASVVGTAQARGWRAEAADRQLLRVDGLHPAFQGELEARLAALVAKLNDARGNVAAATTSEDEKERQEDGTLTPGNASPTPTREWLATDEVGALNRAGAFLESTRTAEGKLGDLLVRALHEQQEQRLGKGAIGVPGGLDDATHDATELVRSGERLQEAKLSPSMKASDLTARVATVVKAARQLREKVEKLPTSFFHKLTSNELEHRALAAAFNELLGLVTPARWAYRDIELTARLDQAGPALGFDVEGAPAGLLFNTAELNASALVLFLLLAPRQTNDLRLLLLDDPLQNMDELTVVTLGRALAKLEMIYPKGWMLLALFHGEDNVERLRLEAPSHIYHLPWLTAKASGETKPITHTAAEKTSPAEWQVLTVDLLGSVTGTE